MECPRCHVELSGAQRFCPVCGLNIENYVEETLAEEVIPEEELLDDGVPNSEEECEDAGAESSTDQQSRDVDAQEPSAQQSEPAEIDADQPIELVVEPVDEPETTPEAEPDEVIELVVEPAPAVVEAREDTSLRKREQNIEARPPKRRREPKPAALREPKPAALHEPKTQDAYNEAKAYERKGIKSVLKRWRTVLVIAGCVIALIAAGVYSMEWNKKEQKINEEAAAAEAKEQDIHTPVTVGVAIELEGYDPAHMTPIPLHVTGSAATGEAVDELVMIQHPNEDALSLLKGVYSVQLGGPVLSDAGDVFEGTIDSFPLAIQEEGVIVNGKVTYPDETYPLRFVFARIEPQNVTDGILDSARAWMLKAEIVNYQMFTDAVLARRQEAVDRLAAEQAAREEAERRAAEEAAKQAEELKKKEEELKKKEEAAKNATATDGTSTDGTTTNGTTADGTTTDGTTTDGTTYTDGTGYDDGTTSYGYGTGNDYGYGDDYSYGQDSYGSYDSGYDYGYDSY
ncbi:MAG: hypothetical protein IKF14_06390 [Atopobiaceae bacterium]|nr:hypothetical protein [Atopobiaceae bacterium]